MSVLCKSSLERIYSHAIRSYPLECCGFVFAASVSPLCITNLPRAILAKAQPGLPCVARQSG